jgi:hypothetical protein
MPSPNVSQYSGVKSAGGGYGVTRNLVGTTSANTSTLSYSDKKMESLSTIKSFGKANNKSRQRT